MASLTAERDMAAKKRSEPQAEHEKRDDMAVKIDRSLVNKARLVASQRKITLAEYISDLIRIPVERDFSKTVRDMGEKGTKG